VHPIWFLSFLFGVLGTPATAASPATCGTSYCITDLGGNAPAFATAINDSGEIVGQAGSAAFLWRDGRMRDLGTLPAAPPDDGASSIAYALNGSGEVVGASGSFGPGPNDGLIFSGAFVYTDAMQPMIVPQHNGDWDQVFEGQQALGINDSGTIVGVDQFRGFVFANGVKTEIAPLSKRRVWNGTVATGVNDAGTIVGATTIGTGARETAPRVHAFARNAAGRMIDLGALPAYRDSIAVAVNRSGEAIGYTGNSDAGIDETIPDWAGGRDSETMDFENLPENGHAVSWKNGAIHDLGGTAALAINDSGEIVGSANKRAVVWKNGRIVDLNSWIAPAARWVLECATGINTRGWIVGWGRHRGARRAFLLKPRNS
jgi:probable HAF family extracellular repeat protein